MVNVMVMDVGSMVDLLWWGRGWWRRSAAVGWAGWSTHWSCAAVSARDGASFFCWDKKELINEHSSTESLA